MPQRSALRSAPAPCRHPVIRAHPETGRKALYVNPAYTVRIEGMDEAASEDLKQQLFDHCLQDKYRMRYKWHAGDALIWEHAAVMHSAPPKDLGPAKTRTIRSAERRVGHECVLACSTRCTAYAEKT